MYLKKFMFLFLMSLLLISLTGCTEKKTATGQVEADIKFGYDGTIKISNGNPLVAKIKNNGAAFKGELQIEIDESNMAKMIVSQPFEMAENATKEIALEVPLYIIQKDFNVSIVTDKELLYEEQIKASKILSPERMVMAVITDTPDSYRFLEKTQLNMYNPFAGQYSGKYPGASVAVNEAGAENLEVIYFDSFDALDTKEKLSFFNYIYMGHSQSLNIPEELENNLNNWISAGNTLILETGADFKKTNSVLPESLNPIKISSTQSTPIKNLFQSLPLNMSVDLAVADETNGAENITFEGVKLGAKTTVGKGSIVTLFVNMALDPIATWNAKTPFIEQILKLYVQNTQQYFDPNFVSPYQYTVQQVPTQKQPPYIFMIILLSIYVALVGPVLYFVLKKADKRDYAWVGIPAIALLCILTLYMVGTSTRYTKAIMNSISVITADVNDAVMEVSSDIMIFNNKKGALKIEWNPEEQLKVNAMSNDSYFMYNYDDKLNQQNKTISGKITASNPRIYEKYNTGLWSSTYLVANKTLPYNAEKMIAMELNGDKVSIKVKNTTPFDLKRAFIKWGQGFIYVGDLAPNDEKTINGSLSKDFYATFEVFIDKGMGIKPFDYSRPPNDKEQQDIRLQEILMQRYVYYNQNMYNPGMMTNPDNTDLTLVKLCAINNQDVGYQISVNDDTTENYATNILEISTTIDFKKGAAITIPAGIINPQIYYYLDAESQAAGAYEYQAYDQYYRFYEQGIAEFSYKVPKNVQLTKAHLKMSEMYSEQDYYNITNGQKATARKGLTYSIFNPQTGAWDEIALESDITDPKYVNQDGYLNVKVDFSKGQDTYSAAQMMKAPNMTIEGSVK